MNRSVLFTLPLIIASSTAVAEEAKKIDPAKQGPTEAVTETVPEMKSDQAKDAKIEGRPATKSVGDAVPPMKPGDEPSKKPETTAPKADDAK